MNNYPWLTTIILFPISAGLLIPLIPTQRTGNNLIRWYALGICLIDFLLMTYVFGLHYDFAEKGIQLKEDVSWLATIDFHWRVGIDGLSIALVLLTGFVTTLATLAAWPVTRNPRLFYFLMLAMYSGQLGLFLSQDLLLFFFMWELELIPVYLLLTLWGGKRRLYSGTKFILYTAGGSIFLLASILTISLWNSEKPILDMEILSQQSYPLGLQLLIYLGFLIAFAVKLPAFPFHTWLPDTHGEAHYSTCMLLAGILLKMGGYGFIRINIEILPEAHQIFAPWLVALGAGQIVYAALVSIAQKNLKRRIAYSSVSHMGFVLIGAGSFTDLGLSGAILQMISHGLIGAGLFFLAGTTYDRSRTLNLDELGGWATPLPKTFSTFTACTMASLALPGMSGFIAELMIFLGLISSSMYSPLFRGMVTIVEAFGIILTPIYLLSMVRKMFYGYNEISLKTIKDSLNFDASPREVFIIFALLIPMLGIGFYPDLTLQLWSNKAQQIVSLPSAQNKVTLISYPIDTSFSFLN